MFLLQQDIFFWDLVILLLMTFSLSGGIASLVIMKRKHHVMLKFPLAVLGLIGIGVFLCVTYGSFIEPQIIVITKKTVTHPLAPNITIAVMGDPHIGPYKGKKFLERAVAVINSTLPDLVLLPGDFVFTHAANLEDLSVLKDIRSSAGVFAVLGNHDVGQYQSLFGRRYSGVDRGNKITVALEDAGITVLRNAQADVELPDGVVSVSGVDDIWTGHEDLFAALDSVPEGAYAILLSHNPSVIEEARARDAHLIVSGHTHGGQIRLPGFGPLTDLPISIDQKYMEGTFGIDDDTTLAITRGIGE